jgi:hypothetical protein
MADSERVGDPRTLADHDEWRMRAVQRAAAEDTQIVSRQDGLHIATVVANGPHSEVMIDAFYDPNTMQGRWFQVLNHAQPIPGESVIWAYVDGSPAVLGPVTNDQRPWRIPRSGMPDTLHFDELDVGSIDAPEGLGISRFTWAASNNSIVSQGAGSNVYHPGIVILQTGAALDEYAYMSLPRDSMRSESLTEMEFMVQPDSLANVRHSAGFVNSVSGKYFLCLYESAAPSGWKLTVNDTTLVDQGFTEPIVPVVVNHWYLINFKRLEPGIWFMVVTDMTADPVITGSKIGYNIPNIDGSPYVGVYNLLTPAKTLTADYIMWVRRRIARL